MRIVKWTEPLPPNLQPAAIDALIADIWQTAPKSAATATRNAIGVLRDISRLATSDVLRSMYYIDKASKKVQARVLDVVIDFAGWLVSLDASEDVAFNGYDVKAKLYAKETHTEIYVTEECKNTACRGGCFDDCADDCEANHNQAKVPKQWPEFCSDACALEWLYNRAKDIATLDNVEESIRKEVEAREAVLVAEVEKQIAESVKIELLEAIDSDDNPVLDVIRVHGKDSRIGADDAARKLESLFRSGVLSM